MSEVSRWTELERFYHAALELEPAERAGFIERSCSHDVSLQIELESLLAHDQTEDDYLEHPAIEAAARELTGSAAEPASLEPGDEIGPYKIVEQIARGGMGMVYRAEQLYPVHRQVALKIIKPGMDSEHVIARFEAERQALALMDHPNIARVLDAGTTASGRLYFVMELVDGLPVTAYCEKHGLSLAERLALFIPICQAIQHAHQKGVIHRDIKPSNILVTAYDGKAVPKVIDFGIAKAMQGSLTDRSMHTQIGAVIGTLEYMSPEQAGAFGVDIDTRSDVYSLGVVLYELITGSTPLNRTTLDNSSELDILRRIREEDPPKPSVRMKATSLTRSLSGDLDWVLMKALDKDRARRYETVNGLARDLQRYLMGEPVEAAPPSVAYRMSKFARKHRIALLTASAFIVLLVCGVVVSSRMAIRASRAEQEALAINTFLRNDLLAQTSAANQSSPSAKADPDLKVRTALDRAAARISGKFERQPELEADIRDTIGQTYLDLGLYPQARKQLQSALDLLRGALGAENPKSVRIMARLARNSYLEGKYEPAEKQYDQALEVSRRVFGMQDPDTLSTMAGLAQDYRAQGKYTRAQTLQSQTLEIQRRVLGPEHSDTLMSMGNLAIIYYQQAKFAEAETLYRQTLDVQRRALGSEHPDTLRFMNGLALTYYQEGKYEEAETLQSQTLQIARRVLGPDHSDTLKAMNNLAIDYFVRGKYPEAEALYSQTLEIQSRLLGPEHPDTLVSMGNLASVYFVLGKSADAEKLFHKTLELKRRVLGNRHPSTLYTISYMSFVYQRQRRYDLAETYASEALKGRRQALGPEHRDTMATAADLALAYLSQGKFAASEPLAREAMEATRKKRPDDWQGFRAASLLGASLAGQKKFSEAEPLLQEGVQGMEARKKRMKVEDLYHLERAHEWLAQLDRVSAASQ